MAKTKAQKLGEYIKKARLAGGLSIRALATATGVTLGAIQQLEAGDVEQPRPGNLVRIAEALELAVADLYAIIGYSVPTDLPEFAPYLRAKYELSDKDVRELNAVFESLAAKKQKKGGRRA